MDKQSDLGPHCLSLYLQLVLDVSIYMQQMAFSVAGDGLTRWHLVSSADHKMFGLICIQTVGAQWFSGRVLGSRSRGCGF